MVEKEVTTQGKKLLNQGGGIVFNTFKLEGFDDIEVLQPGIQYYIELIRKHQYFAFLKRTHGFWDNLVSLIDIEARIGKNKKKIKDKSWLSHLWRSFYKKNDTYKEREKALIELAEKLGYRHSFSDGYIDELVYQLQHLHRHDYYFEAISFRGFSNAPSTPEKTDARYPKKRLREAVLTYCPNQPEWHDALVWKDAVFTGELIELFNVIRGLKVILIGPPHFKNFGSILGLKDYFHLSIHPTEATKAKHQILDDTMRRLMDAKDTPKVLLLQFGTIAFWLIYKLFDKAPNTFYLDMGRALDIWYPEVVSTQPWFMRNRNRIIKSMKLESLYR